MMVGLFSLFVSMLTSLGAITLLYSAYSISRFLTFHLLKPSHPLWSYKRAGPEPTYALITGSSAGIGLGIAQALIKEGFSIILLGHLADELADAKLGLLSLRSAAVIRIIVMDARTATLEEMTAAVKSIANLQVSILVNNVGGNPVKLPAFRTMDTYSVSDVDAVIDMNARFMARLTPMMLPVLGRKSRQQDRSLILSMSSAAWVGIPWLIMYGATKAFNLAFTRGLSRELQANVKTNHIDCLAIIPGEVRSQGNSKGVSEREPTWDHFGQCIVNKVDNALSRGYKELSPFMMHDINDRIFAALPEGIRTTALTNALRHKRDAFNTAYEKSREKT